MAGKKQSNWTDAAVAAKLGNELGIGAPIIESAAPSAVGSSITGGTMMSDGSIAAMSPGGPAAQPVGGLGTMGSAIAVAAALHGGKGVWDAYKNKDWKSGGMSGLEAGAGIGGLIGGPVGAVVGAPLGAVIGGGLARSRSGKSEVQRQRDEVRKIMENLGMAQKVGGSHTITFADGTTFDVGKDGGARLKNAKGEERQYFDVDFSQEGIGNTVGAVNPLASLLTGGQDRMQEQTAGMLTNAATAGGDVNANVRELYAKAQIDHGKAIEGINAMEQSGAISKDEAAAFRNGVNQVFGVSGSDKNSSQGGSSKRRRKGPKNSDGSAPAPTLKPLNIGPVNSAPDKDAMARAFANVYLGNQGLPPAY